MAAVLHSENIRGLAVAGLRMLVVALCYFAAGRIGLLRQVTVEGAVVTPFWPATGIAVGFLLFWGARIWPGIALGALLVMVAINPLRPSALALLAGNTLAPVCSYLMLRQVRFRPELDRLRDGLALVFLGALAGMLISSTVGVGVLVLTDKLPMDVFWPVWSAWWAGDAMGVLVITPLLLTLRSFRLPRDAYRMFEGTALLVATVVMSLVATRSSLGLLFLVFPLLIWAALRFQLAGSAPCMLVVSVAAVWAATDQDGPFAEHSLMQGMVTLQALNGSAALTGLLLAAMVTEQLNTRHKIEEVCQELAEVVDSLAPGESAQRWPLRERRKPPYG